MIERILDTLLGRFVQPYTRRSSRQIITRAAKFYLFDVGVAGSITGRWISEPKGEQFGRAFEHFILMELAANAAYSNLEYPIKFWRTRAGQEVDFILGDGEVAIEVKGSDRIENRDLRGLRAAAEDFGPKRKILVSTERWQRKTDDDIDLLPWRVFLDKLWSGDIVN